MTTVAWRRRIMGFKQTLKNIGTMVTFVPVKAADSLERQIQPQWTVRVLKDDKC